VKQRLFTLALALGALLLFYQFALPKPPSELEKPSEPLSNDAGPDGELGLWQWLTAQGMPLTSLRQRYAQLNTGAASPSGNVLLTVMPHRTLVHADEWSALLEWIGAGNTVLVLAALDDTPRWSLGADSGFIEELSKIARIKFTPVPAGKDDGASQRIGEALRAFDIKLEPQGEHPLLADVHGVHASSEFPADRWSATPVGQSMPLSLMRRADGGAPAVWISSLGKGQVITLSVASSFANREIDHEDNARLLANILAWSRGSQGRVIFDDAHQGLSDFYDARAFFADPRLHRTLWWIVLLWLAFVVGPLPLRSAFSPWRPVDETALIDAGGRFYSNAVSRADAGRRLFENFFNRLRRRLSLPQNGEPLWEWLGSQGVIASEQRNELQTLYARMSARQRLDLTRLQNLLTDLQGKLA
jgi:hypothetical protein